MDSYSQKSELELIESWQQEPGSSAARLAAAELLGRYQRRVYQWCFRYVKDHDQALDLAQDVLLTALQKIDSLKTQTRFATWLFVVTRNCCLGEMRKRAIRSEENVDSDELPSKAQTPETEFFERVSERRLLETMESTLKKTEQEAICLRCIERMPVDSITKILGLDGQSGARGVLQKARRKLKAALEDQGYDFTGNGGPVQ